MIEKETANSLNVNSTRLQGSPSALTGAVAGRIQVTRELLQIKQTAASVVMQNNSKSSVRCFTVRHGSACHCEIQMTVRFSFEECLGATSKSCISHTQEVPKEKLICTSILPLWATLQTHFSHQTQKIVHQFSCSQTQCVAYYGPPPRKTASVRGLS